MTHKSRIVELLKKAPDDIKSMTVQEMLDKFENEIQEDNLKLEEHEKSVCDEFRGAYLCIKKDCNLFGSTTDYMFIKDIKPGSLTTEFNRTYELEGDIISFSPKFVNSRKFKPGDVYDSITESELREAISIDETKFDIAHQQYKRILEKIGIMQNMHQPNSKK